MCESSDPDDVIRSFVSESAPEIIAMVNDEISALLMLKFSDEKIRELIMDEMPCNYCYWMDWESGEMWLRHILQVMTRTVPPSSAMINGGSRTQVSRPGKQETGASGDALRTATVKYRMKKT